MEPKNNVPTFEDLIQGERAIKLASLYITKALNEFLGREDIPAEEAYAKIEYTKKFAQEIVNDQVDTHFASITRIHLFPAVLRSLAGTPVYVHLSSSPLAYYSGNITSPKDLQDVEVLDSISTIENQHISLSIAVAYAMLAAMYPEVVYGEQAYQGTTTAYHVHNLPQELQDALQELSKRLDHVTVLKEFNFLLIHEFLHMRLGHLVLRSRMAADYPLPASVYNIGEDLFIHLLMLSFEEFIDSLGMNWSVTGKISKETGLIGRINTDKMSYSKYLNTLIPTVTEAVPIFRNTIRPIVASEAEDTQLQKHLQTMLANYGIPVSVDELKSLFTLNRMIDEGVHELDDEGIIHWLYDKFKEFFELFEDAANEAFQEVLEELEDEEQQNNSGGSDENQDKKKDNPLSSQEDEDKNLGADEPTEGDQEAGTPTTGPTGEVQEGSEDTEKSEDKNPGSSDSAKNDSTPAAGDDRGGSQQDSQGEQDAQTQNQGQVQGQGQGQECGQGQGQGQDEGPGQNQGHGQQSQSYGQGQGQHGTGPGSRDSKDVNQTQGSGSGADKGAQRNNTDPRKKIEQAADHFEQKMQERLSKLAKDNKKFRESAKELATTSGLPDLKDTFYKKLMERIRQNAEKAISDVEAARGERFLEQLVQELEETNKQQGFLPGFGRKLRVLKAPRPKFIELLKKFGRAHDIGGLWPSYAAPNKKLQDKRILFPSQFDNEPKVAVIVDTSGSMSAMEIGLFLGMMKRTMRVFKSAKFNFLWNDADYTVTTYYGRNFKKLEKDIMERGVSGGGGSVFVSVFNDKVVRDADLIIFVSDFYISLPEEPSTKPVILINTPNYDETVFKYARKIFPKSLVYPLKSTEFEPS